MAIPNRSVLTATGPSGASTLFPLSTRVDIFQVALVVKPGSGSVPTVQYTVDDIWASGYSAGSGNWLSHPDLTTVSSLKDGNLFFPATAVRLVNDASTGAGVASTLTVVQKPGGV